MLGYLEEVRKDVEKLLFQIQILVSCDSIVLFSYSESHGIRKIQVNLYII